MTNEQKRADFEAFARPRNYDLDAVMLLSKPPKFSHYANSSTQDAFEAFQAGRAALQSQEIQALRDDEAVLAHLHLVREYGSARFEEAFNATDPNTPALAQQWAVKAKHAFREIEASARAALAAQTGGHPVTRIGRATTSGGRVQSYAFEQTDLLDGEHAMIVVAAQPSGEAQPLIARPLAEWHEDDGPVMWWAWCGHEWAGEPAWCGTPMDDNWPGYHTHWTPHPDMPAAASEEQQP